MAKPRRIPNHEQAPALPPQPLPSPLPDDEDDEISRVFAELGDAEASVYVFRISPSAPKGAMIDVVSPSEATLEAIKEKFGGGKYYFRVRDRNGVYVKGRRVTFAIEGAPKPAADAAPPPTPAPAPVSDVPNAIIDALRALPQLVATTVRDALGGAAQSTPPRDPLVQTLIEKLFDRSQQQPAHDVTATLRLVEEARANGIELGKAMARNGGSGEDAALGRFLEATGTPLAQSLARRLDADRQAPRAAPPGGAPAAPSPNVPAWIAQVRGFMPVLLGWARAGKDPANRAALVAEDASDLAFRQIRKAAELPTFVGDVKDALPELCAPDVDEWATEFLTALAAEVLDDAPAQPDAQRADA